MEHIERLPRTNNPPNTTSILLRSPDPLLEHEETIPQRILETMRERVRDGGEEGGFGESFRDRMGVVDGGD